MKSRFGLFRPLELQVFRAHGSPERLLVRGRLVERDRTDQLEEGAGLFRNALNTLRRFESDEVPDGRVRVSACGESVEAVTDHEGFFSVELRCAEPVEPGWHEVSAELLESPAKQTGVHGDGELLIPAADCEFGVISDLDDTVIQTGARSKPTQLFLLLSRNARTHVPFPGIADFYRLLRQGPDGSGDNPLFYVSRSGWQLYDLFDAFLDEHHVPRGAMFLMDTAVIEPKSAALGSEDHKVDTIRGILETHPHLDFVLVGDSGQHDPETFLEVVTRWPDRFRAVYLRDVAPPERDREVRRIVAEIEATGVPALAAAHSYELAHHAEDLGLIPAGSAGDVSQSEPS